MSYMWKPNVGRPLPVEQMDTDHIFNAIKMLWNNGVPRRLRVGEYMERRFAPKFTSGHIRTAINALAAELSERKMPRWMKIQFKKMQVNGLMIRKVRVKIRDHESLLDIIDRHWSR